MASKKKLNQVISETFKVRKTNQGHTLLQFNDFAKSMKVLKDTPELRQSIFAEFNDLSPDGIWLPNDIAVVAPTTESLEQWRCCSADMGISYGHAMNLLEVEIKESTPAQGRSLGFMILDRDAARVGLN